MNNSRALKCLCLLVFVLSGCRVQTLYLNGQAHGQVVDAMSGVPIAGAKGVFCGARFLTRDDGGFEVEEATDWEWVMVLAGRSPQDTPHPCYMSIAAPGYQARQWLAPFAVGYDFPIRLLPTTSTLRYRLEAPVNDEGLMPSLQMPPQRDEVFPEAGN